MNKKDKVLTYAQARELIFFVRSVVGVRQDMYEILDKVTKFDERIKRLEKTCDLVENYFKENGLVDDDISRIKKSLFDESEAVE